MAGKWQFVNDSETNAGSGGHRGFGARHRGWLATPRPTMGRGGAAKEYCSPYVRQRTVHLQAMSHKYLIDGWLLKRLIPC